MNKKIIIFFTLFLLTQIGLAQTEIITFRDVKKIESKFVGQAGFIFFEGATLKPVFYFHKDLLSVIDLAQPKPQIYKTTNGQKEALFERAGDYYYFSDNKRVIKSPGEELTLKGNCYLGQKNDGNEAWLAYELESKSLYPQGSLFYLFNPQTKGVDLAFKLKGYKLIQK